MGESAQQPSPAASAGGPKLPPKPSGGYWKLHPFRGRVLSQGRAASLSQGPPSSSAADKTSLVSLPPDGPSDAGMSCSALTRSSSKPGVLLHPLIFPGGLASGPHFWKCRLETDPLLFPKAGAPHLVPENRAGEAGVPTKPPQTSMGLPVILAFRPREFWALCTGTTGEQFASDPLLTMLKGLQRPSCQTEAQRKAGTPRGGRGAQGESDRPLG